LAKLNLDLASGQSVARPSRAAINGYLEPVSNGGNRNARVFVALGRRPIDVVALVDRIVDVVDDRNREVVDWTVD
jgi:hypothetical protein